MVNSIVLVVTYERYVDFDDRRVFRIMVTLFYTILKSSPRGKLGTSVAVILCRQIQPNAVSFCSVNSPVLIGNVLWVRWLSSIIAAPRFSRRRMLR